MPVRILASGDYALFSRPELPSERYSYDVITPSAAVGLIEAIYWKPAIKWVVDRVTVLKPIQFESIKRNEVAIACNYKPFDATTKANRMQRTSVVLRNVAYVIDVHGVATGKASDCDRPSGVNIVSKHEAGLVRRLVKRITWLACCLTKSS